MAGVSTADPILVNDWHVVADLEDAPRQRRRPTRLLGVPLLLDLAEGEPAVYRAEDGLRLRSLVKYGFLWTSLGSPTQDVLDFPEAAEDDRHVLTGGSIAVHVSGMRAVENFLDLAHLPFVHAGYLGAEPRTEVAPYEVEIPPHGGPVASNCRFYQPLSSPNAARGADIDYLYTVIRPYTVALYKSSPTQPARKDLIVLLVQPLDEEHCVAHSLLAYLRDGITAQKVRWFMQLIFAQDKPILENQRPRRLPLDPGAELSIRADASSLAYRRWLRGLDVRYGATPAAKAGPRA